MFDFITLRARDPVVAGRPSRRYPRGLEIASRHPHDGTWGERSPDQRETDTHTTRKALTMAEGQIKRPGPDHQITIEVSPERIVVSVAGRVVADTQNALTLHETNYRPVHYIPLDDVDLSLLEATDYATYCPYKGDCSYYSIPAGGEKSVNAVWTYRAPYPAVAEIIDHVAFYPDRVDAIDEQAQTAPEHANGVSDSDITT